MKVDIKSMVGGFAGAVALLFVWYMKVAYALEVPTEAAMAITTIVTFGVQLLMEIWFVTVSKPELQGLKDASQTASVTVSMPVDPQSKPKE